MEKGDAILGMQVEADDRLHRRIEHERNASVKTWVYFANLYRSMPLDPKPVRGILIGLRTTPPRGRSVWGGDDGSHWVADSPERTYALVVESMRTAPVRVWLDDLRPLGGTAPVMSRSEAIAAGLLTEDGAPAGAPNERNTP